MLQKAITKNTIVEFKDIYKQVKFVCFFYVFLNKMFSPKMILLKMHNNCLTSMAIFGHLQLKI